MPITHQILTSLLAGLVFSQILTVASASPPPELDPTYEQARRELPEDIYVVYRIVERIARANALDLSPWRVITINKYDVNAFATDRNLIAIYSGLLDQVEGDPSAIACVIGHEMAHHTQRHIAMGKAEKQALVEKFKEEAEREVLQEQEAAQSEVKKANRRAIFFKKTSTVLGGTAGTVVDTIGNTVTSDSQKRLEQAKVRIEEIVKEKQAALEAKTAENDRKQEFEADTQGYKYMTKAGFDPRGCLRMMEVLSRSEGAEFDTTHPATRKRIAEIEKLIAGQPPTTLAKEGKVMLDASKPLTYSISRDDQSLRVNSRFGGSTANTIDKMF